MGPPAKKGMNPVIPILVVVALVAVGVGAFFLLSGDDSDGPEAAIEAMVDASRDQDCNAMVDLFSASSIEQAGSREDLVSECQSSVDSGDNTGLLANDMELVSSEVTEETDSNATVDATIRADGETETVTLQLVKEDGKWKIDLGSLAGADSGGAALPPDGGGGGGGGTDTTEGGGGSGGGNGGSGGGAPPPLDDPTGTAEDVANAQACQGGDMAACDELYFATDVGSDLEAYGRSCGGIDPDPNRSGGQCETEFG